jgi:16S rRNA (cytidine1402-2'-O)-methyltransferase
METVGDRPVVVARELTKLHEELVRGPISGVLARIGQPRGEYTVVIEIGYKTENEQIDIGVMTNELPSSRRETISAIARALGLSANEVYAALETLKK